MVKMIYADGHFVSEKHQYIATIIHDYNPELELRFIPEDKRTDPEDREYPFAVWHNPDPSKSMAPYLMFRIKADELDERVLERIFLSDQSKTDVRAHVLARNAAAKLMEEYENAAQAEELAEFHTWLLGTPRNSVKHNGVRYN